MPTDSSSRRHRSHLLEAERRRGVEDQQDKTATVNSNNNNVTSAVTSNWTASSSSSSRAAAAPADPPSEATIDALQQAAIAMAAATESLKRQLQTTQHRQSGSGRSGRSSSSTTARPLTYHPQGSRRHSESAEGDGRIVAQGSIRRKPPPAPQSNITSGSAVAGSSVVGTESIGRPMPPPPASFASSRPKSYSLSGRDRSSHEGTSTSSFRGNRSRHTISGRPDRAEGGEQGYDPRLLASVVESAVSTTSSTHAAIGCASGILPSKPPQPSSSSSSPASKHIGQPEGRLDEKGPASQDPVGPLAAVSIKISKVVPEEKKGGKQQEQKDKPAVLNVVQPPQRTHTRQRPASSSVVGSDLEGSQRRRRDARKSDHQRTNSSVITFEEPPSRQQQQHRHWTAQPAEQTSSSQPQSTADRTITSAPLPPPLTPLIGSTKDEDAGRLSEESFPFSIKLATPVKITPPTVPVATAATATFSAVRFSDDFDGNSITKNPHRSYHAVSRPAFSFDDDDEDRDGSINERSSYVDREEEDDDGGVTALIPTPRPASRAAAAGLQRGASRRHHHHHHHPHHRHRHHRSTASRVSRAMSASLSRITPDTNTTNIITSSSSQNSSSSGSSGRDNTILLEKGGIGNAPPSGPGGPPVLGPAKRPLILASPAHEVAFVLLICLGQAMMLAGLAQSMVPASIISASFADSGPGLMAWFSAAYGLTSATFVLPAGRLGDLFGHKKIFILGWAWFALWSLIAGFGPYVGRGQGGDGGVVSSSYSFWYEGNSSNVIGGASGWFFCFCRGMQGIGPSLIVPNGQALLGRTYPPSMRKNMVMCLFGASAPFGFVSGAILSSVFAVKVWWPWAFWVLAIVCVVLGAASVFILPVMARAPRKEGETLWTQLDGNGMLLGVSGLVLFNFAFNQAPIVSWSTPYTYFVLIIGSMLFAAFVWYEYVAAKYPLIPISAMKATTNFALGCTGAGWGCFGIWVYYTFMFLENMRGWSPLLASVGFLHAPAAGLVASMLAGYLISRIGPHWIMLLSMCAFLIGSVLLATAPVNQSYWYNAFFGILIMPFGMDMSNPAATILLSNSVSKEHQGIAASLVVTTVNYSISLALGIAGTVETHTNNGGLDLLAGFKAAQYFGTGLGFLGVLLALCFTLRGYISKS